MSIDNVHLKVRTPRHPNLGIILVFIVPYFILLLLFKLMPILLNFVYSLYEMDLLGNSLFIGLSNYKTLFQDSLFWKATGNTILYLFYVGPVNIVFGFFLAVLLNKKFKRYYFC